MIYLSNDHIYTDGDGVILPSVTQVIDNAGLIKGMEFIDPYYSDRGTRIHDSIRDKYFLLMDIHPQDDELPFLENFDQWMDESGFKIIYCELIGEATVNGVRYAGKMDLVGTLDGQIGIVDIKNGQAQKWHGAQLNGYRPIATETWDIQPLWLGGLYLKNKNKWLKKYPINNSFKELLL